MDQLGEYISAISNSASILGKNEGYFIWGINDISLFDNSAFRETIINAILHNKWVCENEPMISVFRDRIEILSRGTLALNQTMEGFFQGESIPVNSKLSEIFLQLHISEKSGRGVPKIVDTYGRDAFEFKENSIVVKIPFNWINKEPSNLNSTRKNIINEIKSKPNITKKEFTEKINISKTAIDKNISYLKNYGYIERIDSNKTGYWHIKKC